MEILGQIKSSFIDYPGKICTVLFTGGCNFKCGYCHNPDLVRGKAQALDQREIFKFLDKRKKYLDGVCISGGEPTLSSDLMDFIKKIKKMGFLVKLDTNGTNPEIIMELIGQQLIDYIAMDVKAPLPRYHEVAGVIVDMRRIEKSIDIIKHSDIFYEFRTTVHQEILQEHDLIEIAQTIYNAKRYCIQNFRRSGPLLDDKKNYTPFTHKELNKIKQTLENYVQEVIIK